jgi:DNA polymerase II small subunit/DNA polymerase delta subunit B
LAPGRKFVVEDFVATFKNRFHEMRNILQVKPELDNLVSISKLSGTRQGVSLIGMVYDKKFTKNNNVILEIEDLTGRAKILINKDKEDLESIFLKLGHQQAS